MVIFILMSFVAGIVTIWLYAAVRPRLGAGPGTAIIIAIPVWILASLMPATRFSLLGLFAASDMRAPVARFSIN
jgi:hypothetical protein